jgi:hypothetical protein
MIDSSRLHWRLPITIGSRWGSFQEHQRWASSDQEGWRNPHISWEECVIWTRARYSSSRKCMRSATCSARLSSVHSGRVVVGLCLFLNNGMLPRQRLIPKTANTHPDTVEVELKWKRCDDGRGWQSNFKWGCYFWTYEQVLTVGSLCNLNQRHTLKIDLRTPTALSMDTMQIPYYSWLL